MALRRLYESRKRHLVLLILGLAAVLMLMALVNKCSHPASPFAVTMEKSGGDTLDIAIEMNPTVYEVRGDTVRGRDYTILRRFSEETGVPVKFHPFVPLDYAVSGLENGVFDIVVASMPLTSQLKEDFLMTQPVYIDREVLVQLRDGAHHITSQVQLGGDTVWVPAGQPYAGRLSNLADEIGDTIVVMSSDKYSQELLFILAATGKIRFAVVNEDIAQAMAPDYPQVDISLPVSFSQFQSWALRKDRTALADTLNMWLSTQTGAEQTPSLRR